MNLLWSYAYARNMDMDQFLGELSVRRLRFFADSGAHSARTLGIHIDLESYADWVKRWGRWFTVYANLDVIGAPQATLRNQLLLEREYGLHPMPVFHTGEPFSVLARYLEDGYTYIALGKLLGNTAAALNPWISKAFKMAHGTAVFHGFGMTNWTMLKRFPWYSVDSSSWGSGVRYGALKLFHAGRWFNIRLGDRDAVSKHRKVLDAYAIPWAAVSRGNYDRQQVAGACAAAMYRAQHWLSRLHGPVPLPQGKGYPPPAVGAADRPPQVVPAMGSEAHIYLSDGAQEQHVRQADAVSSGLHLYLADASSKWTRAAASRISKEPPC